MTGLLNTPTRLASNAEALAGTDTQKAITPDDLAYVLASRYSSFYGVSWDESTDTYVRTGTTGGQPVGQTLADVYLPIQRQMRRCVLNDAGVVQYYLHPTDSTKKADGSAAALDGSAGQVMVEIPAFYYRHSYFGTTHTWEISPVPLPGFDLHPAFQSGATTYAAIYVGAYEAGLANDKLTSVSGLAANQIYVGQTRATFRAKAANRGAGWTQELYDIRSAVQLLFLIEYASFRSQALIGAGISNVADWQTYNNYYPIAPTGNSNPIGNGTGNTGGAATCAAEVTKYMSYRGIENWYGHIWKWLDGLNTNNNRSYACNVAASLADDTAVGYVDLGANNSASDGYQSTLINMARGFLPASVVGGSSTTKITDYYWQAAGWRVASSGGCADYGASCGGFCLSLNLASGGALSYFGGRACFRK